MNTRLKKINQLIQEELSQAIPRDIEFKPGILVTVIQVQTSFDLKHAKVSVSILPESETDYAIRTLEKEAHHLCNSIFPRLRLHACPHFNFVSHQGGVKQSRIATLLNKIKKEEEPN